MLETIATTHIGNIPHRKLVRVSETTRLGAVVAQLREFRRGAAMVEDEAGCAVGIFTERDMMLRVDHESPSWQDRPIGDVMTRDLVWVSPQDSVAMALRVMQRHNFRHLPIIGKDGRAVGLLSIRDILAYIVEFFPQDFINLPPRPEQEASRRWGG